MDFIGCSYYASKKIHHFYRSIGEVYPPVNSSNNDDEAPY